MYKVKILQFSFWFSGITELKNACDHSDTDPDHRWVKHSFSFKCFTLFSFCLILMFYSSISSISKCPDKFHSKFNLSYHCHCHDCNKHDEHNQHRYCEQHCNNNNFKQRRGGLSPWDHVHEQSGCVLLHCPSLPYCVASSCVAFI